MSRKTLIICDLCGKEIKNPKEAEIYKIMCGRWSPLVEDVRGEYIDAHESCVKSLIQAKREKQEEIQDAE